MGQYKRKHPLTSQTTSPIEDWLADVFEPVMPLVNNFRRDNIGLEYKAGKGLYANSIPTGKRVTQLPSSSDVSDTCNPQDPHYWMVVANHMALFPEQVVSDVASCPYQEDARLWREALINEWLNSNPFSVENALKIDKTHWLASMMQHLVRRREVDKHKSKVVSWFYTASYEQITEDGKIYGKPLEEIQRFVANRPGFVLLAWAHDFICWLYDYHELLEFKRNQDSVSRFKQDIHANSNNILQNKGKQHLGAETYRLRIIPDFEKLLDAAVEEQLIALDKSTGFNYLQNMFKLMLDCYRDRLLRELQRDDEGFAELRQQVTGSYKEFTVRWEMLTNDGYRRALLDFRTRLEAQVAKVTTQTVEVIHSKGDYDYKFADLTAIHQAIKTMQYIAPDSKPMPAAFTQYIDRIRESYLQKFKAACLQFQQESAKWEAAADNIPACAEEIVSEVVTVLLDPEVSGDSLVPYIKQMTELRSGINNVSNYETLNNYTRSYIDLYRKRVATQYAVHAAKLSQLVDMLDEVSELRMNAFQIVVTMKENINREDVYREACRALRQLDYTVEPGEMIADQMQEIRDDIIDRALDACERFGPKYNEDFKRFQRELYTAYRALLVPGSVSTQVNGVRSKYQDLVKKYSPLESELGTRAGQFLNKRVSSINRLYAKWIRLCCEGTNDSEPTAAGVAFDKFYQSELSFIVATEDTSNEVRAQCYVRLEQTFAEIDRKLNPTAEQEHTELLLMLKNHFLNELEQRFTERALEIQQGNYDNSAIKAFIRMKTPKPTEKLAEFFRNLSPTKPATGSKI